jgi:hypothetical protein
VLVASQRGPVSLAELAEKPVPEMLKNLERADVSGFARICALSSLLPPGYVVVLLNYAGTQVHSYHRIHTALGGHPPITRVNANNGAGHNI